MSWKVRASEGQALAGAAGSQRHALAALRAPAVVRSWRRGVRSVRARSASKGPRPPRPLKEIEAEIADPEKDIVRTLRDVAG
jgi:hypothetical protein